MAPSNDKTAEIVEQIWGLIEPVVRSEGLELVEVEYRREPHGWVLRLFIDKEDGVSVDDCAKISRVAGDLMDVADPIPNPYHLEVSSPGLDRPLRKLEHFQEQIDKIIELRTLTPVGGNRRRFKGILVDVGPIHITMNCDGQVFEIPLSLLERARLCYFESLER